MTANGAIEVDEQYRSSIPHIFAVEMSSTGQPTPVLSGSHAGCGHLTGSTRPPIQYDLIPGAVFSAPNIGTVGLMRLRRRPGLPRYGL